MRLMILGVSLAGLLAACSDNTPAAPPEEARIDALKPGEYEVTATVDSLRSTDKTSPSTRSRTGSSTTSRICVPADGSLAPATFVEAGETCNAGDNYMGGGRLSLQYKCLRGGEQLTQAVDGSFTADSFTGKVTTATYFQGSGDYEMVRTMTGKRVGECSAAPPGEAPAQKAAQ
ncbi:MAG: DUF3617 family protein [Sphingomicrobium sp.]